LAYRLPGERARQTPLFFAMGMQHPHTAGRKGVGAAHSRKAVRFSCLVFLVLSCPGAGAASQQSQKKSPEPESQYRQWLEQDVVYIISAEEREVFLKLSTDEERERFIEQFWARRDPDPSTPDNEFREEHYRRIQHANEQFHAGIPGWRTDRGRIYIAFGPPDRIETHPVGGQYIRPAHEGGGQTSTYPFERWEYRHIEGIGDDIEIEFVDVSGGNLFELSTDPSRKDELLRVPGMGLTDRELFPRPGDDPEDLRRSRVLGIRDAGSAERMGISGERAKYSPFARTELAANLSKPPLIRFTDLREKVEARISYDTIPVRLSYHNIRLSDADVLVPLVMAVPNSALTFQGAGDILTNRLRVYGRVLSLSNSLVYEFDDEIAVTHVISAGQQKDSILKQQTLYRRPLALRPGRYKLETVVREDASGQMGTAATGLLVPNLARDEKLKMSPVVLASNLDKLQPDRLRAQGYLMGQFRIVPNSEGIFSRDGYLAFYFETYDFAVDPSSNSPALLLEYCIAPQGGRQEPIFRDITRGALFEDDRVLAPRQIGLAAYSPGSYELVLRVTDRISGQQAQQKVAFTIH